MSHLVIQGDAARIPLADGSVDLIVTSPPYFALRSYQDGGQHYDGQIGSEPTPLEFLESLWRVTEEMMRVLKPTGSLFVNLGDKYAGSGGHNNSNLRPQGPTGQMAGRGITKARDDARKRQETVGGGGADRRAASREASRRNAPDAYSKATIGGARPRSLMGLPWRYALGCIDDLGLILRAEIVWSKPNGLPESVTNRVRRSHEQWFHFTKEPTYFASVDDVRVEHSVATKVRTQPHRAPVTGTRDNYPNGMNAQQIQRDQARHPNGALPPSVWTIPTEPLKVPEHLGVDHFAAFPTEWPRRLILGWSPPEGVVLDPFGGTGTTALVADALGRIGISLDLSADYTKLALWRCRDSGHARKAIARTALERQASLL